MRLSRIIAFIVIIIYIVASPSIQGASITSVDITHLNQASNFIKTRHYYHGYIGFKTMAQHGCPFSQCILGIMHQKGIGVKKSSVKALYWFKKSARQGFADAERRLGLMYYNGDGVHKNLCLAKIWLRRAANHGAEEAKQLLTKMPYGNQVYSNLSQMQNRATWTVSNIRQAWQGYSELTNEMEELSSVASSK